MFVGQVELVTGDFFDSSSIPKCDAIFMKHILHDWNDADCQKILKACHEVTYHLFNRGFDYIGRHGADTSGTLCNRFAFNQQWGRSHCCVLNHFIIPSNILHQALNVGGRLIIADAVTSAIGDVSPATIPAKCLDIMMMVSLQPSPLYAGKSTSSCSHKDIRHMSGGASHLFAVLSGVCAGASARFFGFLAGLRTL